MQQNRLFDATRLDTQNSSQSPPDVPNAVRDCDPGAATVILAGAVRSARAAGAVARGNAFGVSDEDVSLFSLNSLTARDRCCDWSSMDLEAAAASSTSAAFCCVTCSIWVIA